jgi:hypothetical protein
MTATSRALTSMPDNERLAAQHMKWWPILLIREKRRLNGIAQRVQLDDVAQATTKPAIEEPAPADAWLQSFEAQVLEPDFHEALAEALASAQEPEPEAETTPTILEIEGIESPEDLLMRLDLEFQEQVEFADSLQADDEIIIEEPAIEDGDTKPQLPALVGAAAAPSTNGHHTEDENADTNHRKLRGRGRMLGDQAEGNSGDSY